MIKYRKIYNFINKLKLVNEIHLIINDAMLEIKFNNKNIDIQIRYYINSYNDDKPKKYHLDIMSREDDPNKMTLWTVIQGKRVIDTEDEVISEIIDRLKNEEMMIPFLRIKKLERILN